MAVCLFLFLLFNQSNSLGTRLLRKLVASPWVSNNADNHLLYINYAKNIQRRNTNVDSHAHAKSMVDLIINGMWARGKDSVYYYFFNTYYLRKYSILYQNHKFTECCTNLTQTHRRIYWITLRKDIYKWYGNTLIYQNFLLNTLFKPNIVLHKLLETVFSSRSKVKMTWISDHALIGRGGCSSCH